MIGSGFFLFAFNRLGMERVVRLFENTDFYKKKKKRREKTKSIRSMKQFIETNAMQTNGIYRAMALIVPSIHSPQRNERKNTK